MGRGTKAKCQIRKGGGEEERRLIAEREVGRLRLQELPGDAELRRKEAGGPNLRPPSPPLPGSRCRGGHHLSRGARGGGDGTGTKELCSPDCTGRVAHLASGTCHLLGAHGHSDQGVWTWREIRTLPGEWVVLHQSPLGAGSISVYNAPTVYQEHPLSSPAAGHRNCTVCCSITR